MNDVIAFIVRETGWTLEYIRNLPVTYLNTLAEELAFLKAQDDYRQAYNSALIVCAMCSTKQHRLKPEDIVGSPPQRKRRKGETSIWKLAEKNGIKIPKEI